MSVEVLFPVLSTENPDAEGVVATWFVENGESLRQGQLVAEVQMDKVSADVEAPVAGVIRRIVAEGGVIRQNLAIAVIE